MRKVFTILAVAFILVAFSVDLGQSRSRPYDTDDLINGTPTDDHPWGGDNTGGGGTTGGTGGTITVRTTYTAATGNAVIDVFTYHLMQSRLFKNWLRRSLEQQETTQPAITPGTTTTQSN